MKKLTIRLHQDQFRDLCIVFYRSRRLAPHVGTYETRGVISLYDQITHRLTMRYNNCKPSNGNTMRSFAFYVSDWEFILLSIAKCKGVFEINAYTQTTINTILEKLCTI